MESEGESQWPELRGLAAERARWLWGSLPQLLASGVTGMLELPRNLGGPRARGNPTGLFSVGLHRRRLTQQTGGCEKPAAKEEAVSGQLEAAEPASKELQARDFQ